MREVERGRSAMAGYRISSARKIKKINIELLPTVARVTNFTVRGEKAIYYIY